MDDDGAFVLFRDPREAEDTDRVGLWRLEAGRVEDVPDGFELVRDVFVQDAADGDFYGRDFHAGDDPRGVIAPAVEPFAANPLAEHRHVGAAGVQRGLRWQDGADLVAGGAGEAVGGDEARAGGG